MLTSLQLQRKEKIKTLDKKIIEIQNRNVFLEKNLIDIKEAADHQKPNLKDKVTNLTTKKKKCKKNLLLRKLFHSIKNSTSMNSTNVVTPLYVVLLRRLIPEVADREDCNLIIQSYYFVIQST